jgi:DNA-binding transcriptional MocR family regulator
MQSWLPALKPDAGPKYAAIADAIAGGIRSGELRPGERLPAQRDLAERLGVDLTTVTRAYGLARDAGLIEGAGKLGSFVRNDAALPVFGETASEVGMNVPPQPAFALLPEAIRTGTAALLRAGRHSPILQYQPSLGNMLERRQAAAVLTGRGIAAQAEEIAITAGAQNALHAIVAATLEPGDGICCGGFIYPGMASLAERRGVRLVAVATDPEGLLPDALDAALGKRVKTIYLTPTNDNPTAVTLGVERREAIVAVARRHGAVVIEDDAYGLLPSAPPPPIAGMAPERTWHISGTSKIISPIIRVAYVKAPSSRAAALLAADVNQTAVMAPPLNVALVTLWLRDGTFDRLVAGVRAEAVARQRIALRSLAGLHYQTHPEGYHLWLELGRAADAEQIATRIRPLGLSIVPGSAFAVSPAQAAGHVRISIGGAIDHASLERALVRLREIVEG